VDAAVRDRPDVCLLGLDPSGQSLRVVNEIVSRVPSAAVILLTNKLDEEEFMAAVRAGASGYLTNSLDPARLPHVVQGALRGEPAVPRRFVSRLLDELRTRERRRSVVLEGKGRIALTAREWEVVERLLRAASTSEIARELGVAPVTVRRHVGSVERKLGVSTRAEVVELLSVDNAAAAPA
jgi:DNA-binding NarL/FixJ family response regulator